MLRFYKIIFVLFVLNIILTDTQSTENSTANENELESSEDFMQKTQNMLSSPTGQMLVQVSKELLSRSFGSGQALSLNLTNIVIILFLKVLIFIAGFIGAGGSWTMYARGRNVQGGGGGYWITENEKNLYMGFLAADVGDYGCLSRAACQAPGLAKQYAHAARALLNGYEKFSGEPIENIADYEEFIKITEEGSMKGYRGIPCQMYSCKI